MEDINEEEKKEEVIEAVVEVVETVVTKPKTAKEKKAEAKAKLKADMKAEILAEIEAEKANSEDTKEEPTKGSRLEARARMKVAKLPDDHMVEVQSRVVGELILVHPVTQETLQIDNFGDFEYASMKLIRHFKKKSKFVLTEPMLLILDDDAIDDLQLRKEYDKFIGTGTPEELEALFDKPLEEFMAIIKSASDMTKDTIASLAQSKFVRGELDSHTKISYLEKELNVLLVKQEN